MRCWKGGRFLGDREGSRGDRHVKLCARASLLHRWNPRSKEATDASKPEVLTSGHSGRASRRTGGVRPSLNVETLDASASANDTIPDSPKKDRATAICCGVRGPRQNPYQAMALISSVASDPASACRLRRSGPRADSAYQSGESERPRLLSQKWASSAFRRSSSFFASLPSRAR